MDLTLETDIFLTDLELNVWGEMWSVLDDLGEDGKGYGNEVKSPEITEKELKHRKKSELIDLVLEQNEKLREREDETQLIITECLEDLEDYLCGLPDEVAEKLNNFLERIK